VGQGRAEGSASEVNILREHDVAAELISKMVHIEPVGVQGCAHGDGRTSSAVAILKLRRSLMNTFVGVAVDGSLLV
jgi:hypothetical protein